MPLTLSSVPAYPTRQLEHKKTTLRFACWAAGQAPPCLRGLLPTTGLKTQVCESNSGPSKTKEFFAS